jgi:hypothetical protein
VLSRFFLLHKTILCYTGTADRVLRIADTVCYLYIRANINMKQLAFLFILAAGIGQARAQAPVYGNEIPVTINGYTGDAMEPCISADGNALFFNSLNNGVNTSLYYAAKVNDSTFNLVGLVPLVNETIQPYLNAVASLDSIDHFFWVSLRDYPNNFDNLHHVTFGPSTSYSYGRVHGNFYIYSPGWIIMDAAISYDGNYLYYCNAFFNSCPGGLPCFSKIGIAQKVNDSTFTKLPISETLLAAVNDTNNYIIYAPHITRDGMELYYTRILNSTLQTEICVSTRANTSSPFGAPTVIHAASSLAPEGPTVTTDKSRLYYHKKIGGVYSIVLRNRITTGIDENNIPYGRVLLYPNPAGDFLGVDVQGKTFVYFEVDIYNANGKKVMNHLLPYGANAIPISPLVPGTYFIKGYFDDGTEVQQMFIVNK